MAVSENVQMIGWFFGRGASIACGLDWAEPQEWQSLERDIRIQKIKETLRIEMQRIPRGVDPYNKLLSILEKSTKQNWKHLFITTNWDYLLQREISNKKFKVLPDWLISSHVFHLNGSIEETSQANRSPFLLESDSYKVRKSTIEMNQALSYIIWERLFVIVGMSFKCEMDRSLLSFLHIHEDNLPFGEAQWIILNSNNEVLNDTCSCFKKEFPRADIIPINKEFQDWVNMGLSELAGYGVINVEMEFPRSA